MFAKRTDLALEARELWQESAGKTTRLTGVKAVKRKQEGYPVTRVDILDSRGEEALGKPVDLITMSSLEQQAQMPSEQHFKANVVKERVSIYAAA